MCGGLAWSCLRTLLAAHREAPLWKRPFTTCSAQSRTSMVGATLPMAPPEAIQPQSAEQQARFDTTNSDAGKAEDGTNTNALNTAKDGAASAPAQPALGF